MPARRLGPQSALCSRQPATAATPSPPFSQAVSLRSGPEVHSAGVQEGGEVLLGTRRGVPCREIGSKRCMSGAQGQPGINDSHQPAGRKLRSCQLVLTSILSCRQSVNRATSKSGIAPLLYMHVLPDLQPVLQRAHSRRITRSSRARR